MESGSLAGSKNEYCCWYRNIFYGRFAEDSENREQDVPGLHWQTRTGEPASSCRFRERPAMMLNENSGRPPPTIFVKAWNSGG